MLRSTITEKQAKDELAKAKYMLKLAEAERRRSRESAYKNWPLEAGCLTDAGGRSTMEGVSGGETE